MLIYHLIGRFALEDSLQFMSLAAQALCQDEFSKCFEPKPVRHYPTLSLRYIMYAMGVGIRYGLLFPMRLGILLSASFIFAMLLPVMRLTGNVKAGQELFHWYCKFWLLAISAWVRHHGRKPALKEPHIFVANHTSFTDFFLMSGWEACHATVAQVHGGIFGFLQRNVLSLNGSLFFYRDEAKDREKLARRMRAHTQDWQRSPLVIFPEGTCVNNEYTVLFHKGAFELDCAVCPVAIKYNKRLLDPYWNTREQSFAQHLLYLMTRWFMVADVWWLPAVRRAPEESSITFANRVKGTISKAAGLKNLSWNGYLKNFIRVADQEKLQQSSQMKYGESLRRKLPQLIGDDIVRAETQRVDSEGPVPIRRRSNKASPVEGEEAITDLKNEILINTPPTSPRKLKVPKPMDNLARSWKHHSVALTLPQDSDSDDSRSTGGDTGSLDRTIGASSYASDRLNNTSWRIWSKHYNKAKQGERPNPSDDELDIDLE